MFKIRSFSFPILLLCLSLFVSCTSLRYVEIETYNPSVIPLPEQIKKVLVVDNTVTQPSVAYESTVADRRMDAMKAHADSTASDFCRSLAARIAESSRYDDVRLYMGSVRTDRSYASEQRLTNERVRELCETEGVDAVISLDRFLFKLRGYQDVFEYTPQESVSVEVLGSVRVAVPNESLGTVLLSDTLDTDVRWDIGDGERVFKMVDWNLLLRDVSLYLADRTYIHFVPYWKTDTRWYYTTSGAAWKEAAAYASKDEWNKAGVVWLKIYNKTSGWQAKARLASNLALSEEINGRLGKALEWATQAYELYREHLGESAQPTQTQKGYVSVLSYRIGSDKRLRKDFGK